MPASSNPSLTASSPTVGVLLSGCGRLDGSEIKETVLTLWALDAQGAQVVPMAPDEPHKRVMNHQTGQPMDEQRSILTEASRFTHEPVLPLHEVDPEHLDALIVPGGFGAAHHLSNFAQAGAQATVHPEVRQMILTLHERRRPMGFLCIAPHLIPLILPSGIMLTVGRDETTSAVLRTLGADVRLADSHDVVLDSKHRVASTPAYMNPAPLREVAAGIEALVKVVLAWCATP